MKFYNGEPVKVPVRKAMFIWGCILLALCLLMVGYEVVEYYSENGNTIPTAIVMGIIIPCLVVLFVPGIILFAMGLSRMSDDIRQNKITKSTDVNVWHSQHNQYSPAFSVVCAKCGGLIEYDIDGIDGTRLWYREGYVVCPRCNNVLRHSAGKDAQNFGAPAPAPAQTPAKYCSACGNKLSPTDAFCSSCGKKLS